MAKTAEVEDVGNIVYEIAIEVASFYYVLSLESIPHWMKKEREHACYNEDEPDVIMTQPELCVGIISFILYQK